MRQHDANRARWRIFAQFKPIAQVNQAQTINLTFRTPLPQDDRRVLDDALAWMTGERSRLAGVKLLIESILIDMVAEPAGQDRATVIQRLALEVERLTQPA
jgi:hypothetical protein